MELTSSFVRSFDRMDGWMDELEAMGGNRIE